MTMRAVPGLQDTFRDDEGASLSREAEFVDAGGNLLKGTWVYRDATGAVVDHDRYRNDITERYGIAIDTDRENADRTGPSPQSM